MKGAVFAKPLTWAFYPLIYRDRRLYSWKRYCKWKQEDGIEEA
jgi:hypothetical protein